MTVVGHQRGQQGTQNAALWGAFVQGDYPGSIINHTDRLCSVGKKVQQPVAQGGVEVQGPQFAYKGLWDDCVEC